MKIKVSEASGPVLDWMVAKCLGANFVHGDYEYATISDKVWARGGSQERRYSADWSQGGPIIERLHRLDQSDSGQWFAEIRVYHDGRRAYTTSFDRSVLGVGATPLIAAMRCFVASKLGDEVDVPDELL